MMTNANLVFDVLFIISSITSPGIAYHTSQEPAAVHENYPHLWRAYIDVAIIRSMSQSISSAFSRHISLSLNLLWQNLHRCRQHLQVVSLHQARTSVSIASVCGHLNITIPSTNAWGTIQLEIQMPSMFFLNVTILKEEANRDSMGCFNKRIIVMAPSGEAMVSFCGNPDLPRSVLIQNNIGHIEIAAKPFIELNVSMEYQVLTSLTPNMTKKTSCRDCIKPFNDYKYSSHWIYTQEFTESNAVVRSSHSNKPATFYTWLISVSNLTNKMTEMLQRISLTCLLRNCNWDVVTVHDGPYVGALAATGLLSPFPLLLQTSCMDSTGNDTVESALGEVTITLIDFYPTHVDTVCTFTAVPIQCPDTYCKVDNLQVARTVTHRVTSFTSDRPVIHLLQFTTSEPSTNIHIRIEVLQAAVSHSYFKCTLEGLYIFERGFRGNLCTGDALSMFNSSTRAKGLQFNNSPVTVIIKNYSLTPGIKLIVEYTGTGCYGLVNTCHDYMDYEMTESYYENQAEMTNTTKSCYFEGIKLMYTSGLKIRVEKDCCFLATYFAHDEMLELKKPICRLEFYSSRYILHKWELTRNIQTANTGQPCPELLYEATDHPVTLTVNSWTAITDVQYSHLRSNITSICASNVFIQLLYQCFPADTLYMLNVTICEDQCSQARLSEDTNYSRIATSDSQDLGRINQEHPSATNSSFLTLFSPYHLCGSLSLPHTPKSYWFAFNYRLNIDLPQGDIYCCLIVVEVSTSMSTDRSAQDFLKHLVFNSLSAGIPGCKGEIFYSGVPRLLILRNFIRGHRPEYFTLEKTSPETSYSMTYYMSWLQEKMLRCLTDFTPSRDFEYDHSTHRHTACSGRSCYEVAGSRVNTSWQSARSECQGRGGDLLSINDDYEWCQISYLVDSLCLDLTFIPIGLTTTKVG